MEDQIKERKGKRMKKREQNIPACVKVLGTPSLIGG